MNEIIKDPEKSESARSQGPPQKSITDSVSGADMPSAGNIEKVRDILFGAQMRDFEKKLSSLKDRVQKELVDLRDETRQRFETMESFIKRELESVSERIKSEQRQRESDIKARAEKQAESEAALEKKIDHLDDALTKTGRDLRQQLLDQSKRLSDEIRQKHGQISKMLEEATAELQAEKVNRVALSNLFSEIAMRLTDDWAVNLDLETGGTENE